MKEVGDYALHVQCAWRIAKSDKIVTGRGDIFSTPTEASEASSGDFDWEQHNRFDRIVEEMFENRSFLVQSVHAGEAGVFTLALEDGYHLDVFPQDSESAEHWRFFKPYSEEPHLVFRGTGLQLE